MLSALVFLLVVVQIWGRPVHPPRITGGRNTTSPEQFPAMASLQTLSHHHFCGGTLVDKDLVLTAAHCLYGETPESMVVYLGSNVLNGEGSYYAVKRLVAHEDFDYYTLQNDIGLLQLAESVAYSRRVQSLYLPRPREDPEPGDEGKAVGWSYVSFPISPSSSTVQWLPGDVIDSSECSRQVREPISSSQICFTGRKQQGLCFGDSGSPLVVGDYVVGIVSWGVPCATDNPDVYTRPSAYLSWIEQHRRAWWLLDSTF